MGTNELVDALDLEVIDLPDIFSFTGRIKKMVYVDLL